MIKTVFLGELVHKVRVNKMIEAKSLIYFRRSKITKFDPYKIFKIYRLKSRLLPMEVESVFSKYDSFADALKNLKVSKTMVRRLKYPKKYSKKKLKAEKNKKKNQIKPKRKRSHKKKTDNKVIISPIPIIEKEIVTVIQQPTLKQKAVVKVESGCPNPNYKGKNFDPHYRKNKKKAARAERLAAKSLNV